MLVGSILLAFGLQACSSTVQSDDVPQFQVDPTWPSQLPNQWIIGAVAGVAVDSRDHVWIVHRPSTLQPNELRSEWQAAPPVLEFDPEGNMVAAWGGPAPGYQWPELEHGIYVDDDENVWLGGGGESDAHILKFSRQGEFLLQIGRQGRNGGSNGTANLGGAANMIVDEEAGELYVADGYVNHRVIVFDAQTGAYKRHWGAYGRQPDDSYFEQAGEELPPPFSGAVQHEDAPSQYDPNGPPPPQFRIVHAVRISNDGLVYVCDRTNDRIQVFQKDPRWTGENRPLIDTSKPATTGVATETGKFYFVASSGRKSVWTFVRQLRGPHFRTWAWCKRRSRSAVTAAVSLRSLPQSSTGRLDVRSVDARS